MDYKRISILHNDHGVPESLIREGLTMIPGNRKKGQNIVDFNKIIGYNELVEVSDDEEFFESYRGDRTYPSRFVKNRLPVPCTKLAIVWQRVTPGFVRVITAYFTDRNEANCPDEPGNILRKIRKGKRIPRREMEASYNFWSKHAFVESTTHQCAGSSNIGS